jgi:hypothetical protein
MPACGGWWGVLLVMAGGCGAGLVGDTKYPVEGEVLIQGEPRANVSVQFWHQDPSIQGNDRYPTGMTDAQGRFRLSSYAFQDGAVPGDYVVTFSWMSSTDIDGMDLLDGAWGDPESSPFRATVRADSSGNRLDPFELEVSEAVMRRVERTVPAPGP